MKFKEIVDISYGIRNGMTKYPSDPEAKIEMIRASTKEIITPLIDESGASNGAGISYTHYKSGYTNMNLRNHHGTHIDAPAHKLFGEETIDLYHPNKFINTVEIVDLTQAKIYTRSRSEIGVKDIMESNFCDLLGDANALLFYTGFMENVNTHPGLDNPALIIPQQFPFFSKDAMIRIISLFPKLNIIGLDSLSFDPSGSNSDTHRLMFRHDVLPLETICNFSALKKAQQDYPNAIKTLLCPPLLIENSDAAQTRALVGFE